MSEAADEDATVLLVEDNPGDVRLVEEAFRKVDSETALLVVSDGRAALDVMAGRGEYADTPQPDLVLLDLNLPRLDGGKLLAELKADPDVRRIPVVVLTSSQMPEDVVRAYDRHANAYLTKPVDPAEFIDAIEAIERFWLGTAELPGAPD